MAPNEHTDVRPALLSDVDDETHEGARMSFLEHLEEFRRRLIYSIYAIIGGCILPFLYANRIYEWMTGYFHQVLPHDVKMIFTEAPDGFMFSLKLSFLAGLIIASPFVLAQMWLFVAPGLYTREKKVVIPFVFFATTLFLAGAAFSHYVAFITMWRFFATYSNQYVQFMPTIKEAFGLYVWMLLGLGTIFQLPIIVFFLAHFGIITWQFLVRQWKYAILIIFVVAAAVTPSPDFMTQFVFAAPMFILYLLSIGVAWMFGRPRKTAKG